MTKRKPTAPITPIAQQLALLQTRRKPLASRSHAIKQLPRWTGLAGKTLWDWLSIILIPIILAIYALITTVNMAEKQNNITEQQTVLMEHQNTIADEQLKSQVLRDYTSTIQELILHEGLLQSRPKDNVRIIATTQTALALEQLDARRKAHLLLFLYRSKLIEIPNAVISLNEADLSGAFLLQVDLFEANLGGADLTEAYFFQADLHRAYLIEANLRLTDLRFANLSGADLSGANLLGADLGEAILSGADLSGATLLGADLSKADLSRADLRKVNVTSEQLKQAKSLQGATMPDGSIHP